ncbi:14-3-3-like protein [Dendrothele bispora CBS 962.96]|uniref:14-3-3-like protein n=1 Tax=Dendrothele bispora (strain CBS 962.96) TaxID=1314807 RepID=A0A4S8MZG7_DENBC|nr:14-3-3-like protein [Dendrothele bispora CBS 962.96]
MQTRAELLFIAELAGEAERYDDVISQIKIIINRFGGRLTGDERNLLSIAYKNTTNTLRASWRIVDTLEKMQSSRTSTMKQLHLLRRQRARIGEELANVCKDIVQLLDGQLLPLATQGEERVFYAKMKGDYYRYLSEFAQENHDQYAEESLNAYKFAYKHALTTLESIHPTRLGLALNFAVFYHDVHKSPDRACHLAKAAFDEAVMSLQPPDGDPEAAQSLRDSLQILQLLRDDLILWSREIQE